MSSPRPLALLLACLFALAAAASHAQMDSFASSPPTSADRPEPPAAPEPKPARAAWNGPAPDAVPEVGMDGEFVLNLDDPEAELVRVAIGGEATGLFIRRGEPYRDDTVWRIPVTLTSSGDQAFGPFEITARSPNREMRRFLADPVELAISQPEGALSLEELRDYLPLFGAPLDPVRVALFALAALAVLAGGALGLLALALGAWWWLRRGAGTGASAEQALPPIDEALQALAALRTLDDYRSEGARAHYTGLSFALRRYFERAKGLPALELTDDEMAARLEESSKRAPAEAPLLAVFANASLAKYAKFEIAQAPVEADLDAAEGFLREEKRIADEAAARAEAQARKAASQARPAKEGAPA